MIYAIIAEAVFCIIHLIICFLNLEKARKWTKPFVLLPLFLILHTLGVNNFFVYLVLILGILGDILLIFAKSKMTMVPGGICFLLEHLLIIHFLLRLVDGNTPIILIIVFFIIALFVTILIYQLMKKSFKEFMLSLSGYVYMLVIELMLAVLLVMYNASPWALLLLSGAICFITSDTLLAFKVFGREIPKIEFHLMLPYLMAQILLCIGLANIL